MSQQQRQQLHKAAAMWVEEGVDTPTHNTSTNTPQEGACPCLCPAGCMHTRCTAGVPTMDSTQHAALSMPSQDTLRCTPAQCLGTCRKGCCLWCAHVPHLASQVAHSLGPVPHAVPLKPACHSHHDVRPPQAALAGARASAGHDKRAWNTHTANPATHSTGCTYASAWPAADTARRTSKKVAASSRQYTVTSDVMAHTTVCRHDRKPRTRQHPHACNTPHRLRVLHQTVYGSDPASATGQHPQGAPCIASRGYMGRSLTPASLQAASS